MDDERPPAESPRRSRFSLAYERFLRRVPRQSRSVAAVDAILTAMLDRLQTDAGAAEDTPVQEVAARAGVGIASLYDYFADRTNLLAAAATKDAEDHLDAFHALLETTENLPVERAVEAIVDYTLDTYARRPARHRVMMRLAASLGLLPTLAASQRAFAASLASALRRRTDVTIADPDLAGWVLTQSMMGMVMAAIWEESPPDRAAIRRTATAMFLAFLTPTAEIRADGDGEADRGTNSQ
ncbi:MAG: TetR family transcriptional regulator [Deltaproteobacteria bacterium]|nr:TetR family transcriptional regulator [Deltaproteobacteria bacterium]